MFVHSVGIGATTPNANLEVLAQTNSASVRIASKSTGGNTSQVLEFGAYVNGQFRPGGTIRFSTGQSSGRRLLQTSGTVAEVTSDVLSVKSLTASGSATVAGSLSTCACLCLFHCSFLDTVSVSGCDHKHGSYGHRWCTHCCHGRIAR